MKPIRAYIGDCHVLKEKCQNETKYFPQSNILDVILKIQTIHSGSFQYYKDR